MPKTVIRKRHQYSQTVFWKFSKMRQFRKGGSYACTYTIAGFIYSPVCRYKTHEAGHGNARGRPHISILGNRDADDFRTCQDVDTV